MKALLVVARALFSVPVLEVVGGALLVVALWGAGGPWLGLGLAGVLVLLKAFDLALEKGS